MYASRIPVVCVDGSLDVTADYSGASQISCKDYVQQQTLLAANAPFTEPQDFNGYAGTNVDVISGLYPGGYPTLLGTPAGTAWSGFVVVPSPAVGGIEAVGCQNGGYIYTFVNGVATPRAVARQWVGMAMSAQGMAVAITSDSLVFGSTDYITWSPITVPAPPVAGAVHNMNGVISPKNPFPNSDSWFRITCSGVATTTQFYTISFINFGTNPAISYAPTNSPLVLPYACPVGPVSGDCYFQSLRLEQNGTVGYTCVRYSSTGVWSYTNLISTVPATPLCTAASPDGRIVILSGGGGKTQADVQVMVSFDYGASFTVFVGGPGGLDGFDQFAFLTQDILIAASSFGSEIRVCPNANSQTAATLAGSFLINSHKGDLIVADSIAFANVSNGYKTSGPTVYYPSKAQGIFRSLAVDNCLKVISNSGPLVLGDALAGTVGATTLALYGAGNPAAPSVTLSGAGTISSTGTLAVSAPTLAVAAPVVTIAAPSAVTVTSPSTSLVGNVYVTGNLSVTGAESDASLVSQSVQTPVVISATGLSLTGNTGVTMGANSGNVLISNGGSGLLTLSTTSGNASLTSSSGITYVTSGSQVLVSAPTSTVSGSTAALVTSANGTASLTSTGTGTTVISSAVSTRVAGTLQRNIPGSTVNYATQPVIQVGVATGSGATGTVSVDLTATGYVPYSSVTNYIVQVTTGDTASASVYVQRTSASAFTIGWSGASAGAHSFFWTTYSF